MKNVLFITWDGPQTTYLKGLFLPIFIELQKHGYKFHIIQYSWNEKNYISDMDEYCKNYSIEYKHIKVHRKPSVSIGSLLTCFLSIFKLRKFIKNWDIDIVMPRSTLPALSLLLSKKKNDKYKLIFDADGLPLDERVEFNNSNPLGFNHNFLRLIETQMTMRADKVIVRSEKAKEILFHRIGAGFNIDKFHLVSNGRDSNFFKVYSNENSKMIRNKLNVKHDELLIVFVGTLAPKYSIDKMLLFFKKLKEHINESKFLVISRDHTLLNKHIEKYKNLNKDIILKTLDNNEVSQYLNACDLGLAIIKNTFSMQAVAPIKMGEYLMSGVPVIATSGIGDTFMIDNNNGFLLENITDTEIENSIKWFLSKKDKLRNDNKNIALKGKKYFSFENSISQYLTVLEKI